MPAGSRRLSSGSHRSRTGRTTRGRDVRQGEERTPRPAGDPPEHGEATVDVPCLAMPRQGSRAVYVEGAAGIAIGQEATPVAVSHLQAPGS